MIDEKLKIFSEKERIFIEKSQDNRKSFIFNALLKLFKFGDINEFVDTLSKGLKVEESQPK